MFKLRGPGYNAIEKCVNDSDFYTLEPLAEIPKQEFFSYSSGGPLGPSTTEFSYGFNIHSLIQLMIQRFMNLNQMNEAY